jgi:hypothetical protein
LLIIAGCDSSVGPDDGTTATINGTATDNAGYGKRAANIEGAVVSAANVESDGNIRTLSASTTTNVSGAYSLEISNPSPIVLVKAEKEDYSSSVLVYTGDDETADIQAQPINVETHAEANVYVDTRSNGDDHVTIADVALFVDKELAGQIASGTTSSSEVATVLTASSNTEAAFLTENSEAGEGAVEQANHSKVEAYGDLQASLAAAGETSAQSDVLVDFEQTVHDTYFSAEIPADVYAKARQSANTAVSMHTENAESSSDAQFALRRQSEIVTAGAMAQSIEASFEAENASQTRLTTLADARTQLLTDLRGATTVDAMTAAKTAYKDTVKAELAATLDVSNSVITSAEEALSDLKATLNSSLSLDISASATAEAHSTFYGNAESTAASSLGSSAKAEMGGKVLAMLSLY